MTWLVFGGTSGIGFQTVQQASQRGLIVRAFGRSAASVSFADGIEPFVGDATNPQDVEDALAGCSVVVQALGVKERPAMAWEEETLFSSATAVLLPLMKKMGVQRLICVTGYGAGDSAQTMSSLARAGHRMVLGKIYDDKSRQETLIEGSDLDWTIARPTVLTNGSLSKRYKVLGDKRTWRMGMISRADVADFVVGAGEDGTYIGQSVVLT